MRKRISYFKKIRLFWNYSRGISKISEILEDKYNARVDRAYRIYTVINLPPTLIEEPYNLKKQDIDNLANTFIKDYSNQLSSFLNSKNLMELYDFYEIKKVDKYSYLVVYGFSLFNSAKFLRNFLISTITLSMVLTLILIFFL